LAAHAVTTDKVLAAMRIARGTADRVELVLRIGHDTRLEPPSGFLADLLEGLSRTTKASMPAGTPQ
jgi:hypothetical protein